MSVFGTYGNKVPRRSLTMEGLRDRLRDNKFVHDLTEGVVTKPDMLDLGTCDAARYEEFFTRRDSEGRAYQLDDAMAYMPVTFSEDGNTMSWFFEAEANFATSPAEVVQHCFPEEVMLYQAFDKSDKPVFGTYCKDGEMCREDGTIVQSKLDKVFVKELPNQKPGREQVCVSLPLSVTDKHFAKVYVDKENIEDTVPGKPDGKKSVLITDLDSSVRVYRCLKDGSKTKDIMSWREVCSENMAARITYAAMAEDNPDKVRSSTKDRPLPKVSYEAETGCDADFQME